jgi:DNA-binding SARP family transcriptional activator
MVSVRDADCDVVSAVIEFQLLGRFGIRAGDAWHAGPSAKKGGWLLQYLAAYPRRVATRDQLAAAFWPSCSSEDVTHRIHLTASGARAYLRALFGGIDALQFAGSGYCWAAGVRIVSDVDWLLAQSRHGTFDGYRRAIDLYGGEFLAGETADWLQPMRIKVATARDRALESLAVDLMQRDQWAQALDYALELIDSERGHEAATRLVMRCFAQLGQPARALQQYRLLTSYLLEQIGVEPSTETKKLASDLFPAPR